MRDRARAGVDAGFSAEGARPPRPSKMRGDPVPGHLAPPRPGQAQPRFGHGERVLELGLLGGREGAGELFLGATPRLLSACDRDLFGVLRHVGEHRHPLWKHLEKASADEQRLLGSAEGLLDSKRAWFEDGHERRMACEHAELALCPGCDDELDVALEQAAFDAYHAERELHSFFFIPSACARASSMVPTM